MSSLSMSDARQWAAQMFGGVQLGDPRRGRRVVQIAAALIRKPAASLPNALGSRAGLKGAYHLLHTAQVTHGHLLAPVWERTRAAAGQHPVVLLTGDLTTLDYSHHPTTTGLGPIGNGRGRGYVVHSVLAILPQPRRVLGLAHQIPYVPAPKRHGETLRQRQARPRQTDVWQDAVAAIGSPPVGVRWVHVGDRGSDIFRFLHACRQHGCDFLVRAAKNRRIAEVAGDGEIDYLKPLVRSWQPQARQAIDLPGGHGKPARRAELALSWRAVELQVPRQEAAEEPVLCWVVRVWEPAPPDGVTEPIEWLLLSSVPVATVADAWERVSWYTCRWTNEDFHSCLKTGCRIEQRHLGDQSALERLLALCSPVAVHLLQVRDAARLEPEQPAGAVVGEEVAQVVAALAGQSAATLTIQAFWHAVARRGGWLGRTGDGPPGWKTLWNGWQEIQAILEGVHLARTLPPPSTSG